MRSQRNVWLLLAIVLVSASGCQDVGQPTGLGESGRIFDYVGYNLTGTVVATGTITLTRENDRITGERNLKSPGGAIDTGFVGGTINPDGSFQAIFDDNMGRYAYVSLVGKRWPTSSAVSGDIVTFSGTATWSRKTGEFRILPLW